MPHTHAQKEAAYPLVRVYAATKEHAKQLAKARRTSVMAVMAEAVETLLKAEERRARRAE